VGFFATLAYSISKLIVNAIGHQKFGVLWPAVKFLHQLNFFFAQRLAMRI
jgi:hypothetical protein